MRRKSIVATSILRHDRTKATTSAWPREKHTNYLTSDSFPKLPVRDRRFAEEGAVLRSTTYPVFTVITLGQTPTDEVLIPVRAKKVNLHENTHFPAIKLGKLDRFS
jgi:hypothetical protein